MIFADGNTFNYASGVLHAGSGWSFDLKSEFLRQLASAKPQDLSPIDPWNGEADGVIGIADEDYRQKHSVPAGWQSTFGAWIDGQRGMVYADAKSWFLSSGVSMTGQSGSFSCVDHSQASTDMSVECCPGYKKWTYDAKTGTPYDGFMCWSAPFASEGQYAGPGGQGNFCFPGLVNVDGKCSAPPADSSQPGNPPPDGEVEQSPFEFFKNPWVIAGALALLILPFAFKK